MNRHEDHTERLQSVLLTLPIDKRSVLPSNIIYHLLHPHPERTSVCIERSSLV
jgi:hypothetical protein